ncbi:MAG TPA: uroporphyrinogen decarboxylase [Chloroflexota bacterium]|nr:uroporphyrinogen decarboxylase [Chloroflexota bacterium]
MTEGVVAAGSRLLRTLRLQPVDATPVWFMRQAGRALPEYRSIRERYSLLEICAEPELCAQVTLQPLRILDVDAAILFADIMTPLIGIGLDIDIVDGVGPVVAKPLRTSVDLERLKPIEPQADVAPQLETIRLVRSELDGSYDGRPLIGFAGAPFTLASYLIEGRASRDFVETKTLMYRDPALWKQLMDRLAQIVAAYLTAQLEAGAQVVQIFDSWAGALSPADYSRFVAPYSRRVFDAVATTGSPAIHFSSGTSSYIAQVAVAGGDAVSVDWRAPLDRSWKEIGHDRAIQGNLDPLVLLGPWSEVKVQVTKILRRSEGRPGHIFNLGHGVHPRTRPDQLRRVVDWVHESGR